MIAPARPGELLAVRFQILDQIPSRSVVKHAVAEKPIRVATLIRRQAFEQTKLIRHHETVFLEDRIHDWDWSNGQFRYYSRVADVADVVLIFEETRMPKA